MSLLLLLPLQFGDKIAVDHGPGIQWHGNCWSRGELTKHDCLPKGKTFGCIYNFWAKWVRLFQNNFVFQMGFCGIFLLFYIWKLAISHCLCLKLLHLQFQRKLKKSLSNAKIEWIWFIFVREWHIKYNGLVNVLLRNHIHNQSMLLT